MRFDAFKHSFLHIVVNPHFCTGAAAVVGKKRQLPITGEQMRKARRINGLDLNDVAMQVLATC